MKHRQWKKLICLLLALKMLSSPLVQAVQPAEAEIEDTEQGTFAPIFTETTAAPAPTETPEVTAAPAPEETLETTTLSDEADLVEAPDGEETAGELFSAGVSTYAASTGWKYLFVSPNYYAYVREENIGEAAYTFEYQTNNVDNGPNPLQNRGSVTWYSQSLVKSIRTGRVPNYEFAGWYAHKLADNEIGISQSTNPLDVKKDWITMTKAGLAINDDYHLEAWDALVEENNSVTISDELIVALDTAGITSEDCNGYLFIYAKWELSKNATIVDDDILQDDGFQLKGLDGTTDAETDLSLFGSDIQGQNTTGLNSIEWDPEVTTYYARAMAEQASARLTFATYEPGSQIEVTVRFGGQEVKTYETFEQVDGAAAAAEKDAATWLHSPPSIPDNATNIKTKNTFADPARRIWSLEIPLEYSDGNAGEEYLYNAVTIAVTPPAGPGTDSENVKTYTINIQRLRDPEIVQDCGNVRSSIGRTDKQFTGEYSLAAWGAGTTSVDGTPDADPNAVAVYLGDTVTLPGLTLIDSEGYKIPLGNGGQAVEKTLRYTLKMDTADQLTTDVILDANSTLRRACYYNGTSFLENEITGALSYEQVELNLKDTVICPGRYSIEYSYADPISGRTYSSKSDRFYDTTKAESFARTLLALAAPGDVDMDGAVTTADAIELEKALKNTVSFAQMDGGRLFTYRVCDVTGDGAVDDGDVAKLYGGFVPTLNDYFYLPLNWQEIAKLSQPEKEVAATPDSGKARLTVEFLGTGDGQEGVELNNIFWMGIKLENIPEGALTDKLNSFTVSLDYNSNYLRPAFTDLNDDEANIFYTETYESANESIWGSDYDYSHSVSADGLSAHITTAKSTLSGETQHFREVRVTVQLTAGGQAKSLSELSDGYILKIPFELVRFPLEDDMVLVEPGLGMRELNLTTVAAEGAGSETAAWSAQPAIYGKATTNLADLIEYCGAETIPLGEDTTPAIQLTATYGESYRIQIGASDQVTNLPEGLTHVMESGADMGYIVGVPAEVGTWEFYYKNNKTEAKRYILEVQKAPLTVWVDNQGQYYGEEHPELTFSYDTSQLKAVDETAEREFWNTARMGAGAGADLEKLLGYTPPTVTTDVTSATEVGTYEILLDGTKMVSDHYEFRFVSKDQGGNEIDAAETAEGALLSRGTLTVYKRPLWLQQVTKNPVGSLFSTDTVLRLSARSLAHGYYRQGDFTLATPTLSDGKYGNTALNLPELPLTADLTVCNGDDLHISFDALFKADRATPDLETNSYFDMNGAGQKLCPVTVDSVILDEDWDGGAAKNYEIMMKDASSANRGKSPVDDQATGLVTAKKIVKLEILKLPDNMSYTHGDRLSLTGLGVQFYYEDSDEPEITLWSENLFASKGLTVSWAYSDGVGGFKLGEKLDPTCELSRSAHNGAYICVSVETFKEDEDGNVTSVTLYAFTDTPLTISKKTLTFILHEQRRYYGEPNPDYVVTYDVNDLAPADRPGRTGNLSDFVTSPLTGYTSPAITTAKADGTNVDDRTDAGTYTISISGAESADYDFLYQGAEAAGPNAANTLTILPRPIIVAQVNAAPPFIYNDTETEAGTGTTTIDGVKLTYGAGEQDVCIITPQAGVTYFRQTNKTNNLYETEAVKWETPLTVNAAVLEGDSLEFTYRAVYQRDNQNTEGKPYFTLAGENPCENRTVVVEDVKLLETGSGKNYTLIFTRGDNAANGWTGTTGSDSAQDETEHQITGEVKWRPIQKLEIISAPSTLEYTYGTPLSLEGLTVRITSENITYENADDGPEAQTLVRELSYYWVKEGEEETNSFAQAGLKVTWNSSDGDEAAAGEYVTVAERDGATLVVTAQRQSSHEPISKEAATVKVNKKLLPLTVQRQYKYYGEANVNYKFTFSFADLARPDRDILDANQDGTPDQELAGTVYYDESAGAGGLAAGYGMTGADLAAELAKMKTVSAALSAINALYETKAPYVGPVFVSECTMRSPVDGSYPLTLQGGEMANYAFAYVPSETTVFRRPIQVSEITKNPIYTVFAGAKAGTEYSAVCTYEAENNSFAMQSLTGTESRPLSNSAYDPDYTLGTTGLLKKAANILPGDDVSISMKVTLQEDAPTKEEIDAGTATTECTFTVSGMTLTAGSENYCLYYTSTDKANRREPQNTTATGVVQTRKITSVEIIRAPRLDYTYGQSLDLSQFSIRITYEKNEDEENSPVDIKNPIEVDGVYINYWPADQAVSENSKDWEAITASYPQAANGDHLTIAVDDQGFAHNGMKLIVSARSEQNGEFIKPAVTDGSLVITPLDLTYKLSAENKVYDGTTNATGAITLTNPYVAVDESGTKRYDEVYVETGTTYGDFQAYAAAQGYTFISEADSARAALKFDFEDPDVAYRVTPTHDNYGDLTDKVVEVTGISLGGKDAANYRINESVKEDTQQIPNRDSAPRATITKADRTLADLAILLTTDMNTNTVKVSVEQSAVSMGDLGDRHNSAPEIHYEYALEYLDPDDESRTIVLPWQDGAYFGGEAVDVDSVLPDGAALPENSGAGQKTDPNDVDFGTRDPLPRDTYFRALVRLAESHNYNASNVVYSVADLAAAVAEAMAQAEQLEEPDKEIKSPQPMEPSPLGKTYRYRLDLLSSHEVQVSGGEKTYVRLVEGVWFNDTEDYKDSQALNLAVDNLETTLYYGFYWDEGKSKTVGFPLNVEEAIQTQTVPADSTSTPGEGTEQAETLPENTLRFYVALEAPQSGSVAIRSIQLSLEEVNVLLGDAPVLVTVEYTPRYATSKRVTWTSSDEGVVTVDTDGVLTFVGVGQAVVTAATRNGKTASVIVTVTAPVESPFEDTLFNVDYEDAYMEVDGAYNFYPDKSMTRGEVAELLAKFLKPAGAGELARTEQFIDVDSSKSYADAVTLMRARGIVNGVGGNYFDGERDITREEVAAMLGRMLLLGREGTAGQEHAFVDCTEETSWAWAYVDDLARAGIAEGGCNACFYPDCAVTRAEMAAFIARILVNEADPAGGKLLIPADMTAEHWAYDFVLRAVNSVVRYKTAE